MNRRLLVLSEGWLLDGEAVRYARSVAHRTDSELVLLMLLPTELDPDHDIDSLRLRGERHLRERMAAFGGGLEAAVRHVRAGDPWSEFCKFVGSEPRFQMVVWAGACDPPGRRRAWFAGHWISRAQRELGCPVVFATRRWSPAPGRDDSTPSGAE